MTITRAGTDTAVGERARRCGNWLHNACLGWTAMSSLVSWSKNPNQLRKEYHGKLAGPQVRRACFQFDMGALGKGALLISMVPAGGHPGAILGLQLRCHQKHDDDGLPAAQLLWPDLQLQAHLICTTPDRHSLDGLDGHQCPLISHCLSRPSPEEAHGVVDPHTSEPWEARSVWGERNQERTKSGQEDQAPPRCGSAISI